MGTFFLGLTFIVIFQFAVVGLIIPGPNPMTWGRTAVIGITGSFLGGIIANILGVENLFSTLIQISSAAAIIVYLERR